MATLIAPNGLTATDLEKRRNYITATDAAAILGTSPWRTKYDVWLEKCVEMEPFKATAAMFWGSLLEDDIILFAEMELREFLDDPDLKATRLGTRRVHPNGVMSATLDAVVRGREDIIEAKTHAAVHPNVNLDDWGDPWTDAVPPYYRDQVLAQLACCAEKERVWVVLSVGRMVPTLYVVERANHAGRIAEIENACCDFWDTHIVTCTPPGDCGPSMDSAKRIRTPPQQGIVLEVADEKLERSKLLAAQKKTIEEHKEAVDAEIRSALELAGATEGRSPKGHRVYLNEINRKGYTVAPTTYKRMDIRLVKGA